MIFHSDVPLVLCKKTSLDMFGLSVFPSRNGFSLDNLLASRADAVLTRKTWSNPKRKLTPGPQRDACWRP